MPTTDHGIVYPDSSEHTRLWDHLHNLADSVEAALDALEVAATTFTPVITTTGNPITTSTAAIKYKLHDGKIVTWWGWIHITTAGTGSGFILMTLPLPVAVPPIGQTYTYIGSGRQEAVGGKQIQVRGGGSTAQIATYDNLTPIGTGVDVLMSGQYLTT